MLERNIVKMYGRGKYGLCLGKKLKPMWNLRIIQGGLVIILLLMGQCTHACTYGHRDTCAHTYAICIYIHPHIYIYAHAHTHTHIAYTQGIHG
jgi:hypothetical protein